MCCCVFYCFGCNLVLMWLLVEVLCGSDVVICMRFRRNVLLFCFVIEIWRLNLESGTCSARRRLYMDMKRC